MHKDSFEHFYYEKVGLGEGCGCAEHVTRIRDLDALVQRLASGRMQPSKLSMLAGERSSSISPYSCRGTCW